MTDQHNSAKEIIIDERTRAALMLARQGFLLVVQAIEEFLGLQRTKPRADNNK